MIEGNSVPEAVVDKLEEVLTEEMMSDHYDTVDGLTTSGIEIDALIGTVLTFSDVFFGDDSR